MTILCVGDTHVFQLGSSTCDCGLWPASIPRLTKPYPLSGGVIPGYTPHNPYAPPRPPTPPVAGEAPPLHVFEAARRAGASHLSMDGKYVYTMRYGKVLQAEWDGSNFGAWLEITEMPKDAVEI